MICNILFLYYIAVNVFLFVVMGIDKYKAKRHLWRVPESFLFFVAFLGGSIGGFLGMFCFRHKIRKYYFYILYLKISLLLGCYFYMDILPGKKKGVYLDFILKTIL